MQGFNSTGRTTRPKFSADQADVAVGRRVNDLLAYATEIAAANEQTFPIVLSGEDRLMAAMLLENTTNATAVLQRVVGELIEAAQADAAYDHNDLDTPRDDTYRQSAAAIARDVILADIEANR